MRIGCLFLALSILLGCTSPAVENEFNSQQDQVYEFTDLTNDFAENFQLSISDHGYLLELIDPNSHEVESEFILTYNDSLKGDNIIQLPCTRIANLSQTSVGMMSILGVLDNITGISNIQYVYSQEIKDRFAEAHIVEFGDETNFPIEKIVASNSELILYSGFGKEFPQSEKLAKFGITSLPNYDWRESHPLGKAEWIKVIGVLCGKEKEALSYFEKVKKSYQELCWKAAQVEQRPTVMSGSVFGGIWYAPAGESYMAMLFADAGADYTSRFSYGSGSIELGIEQILSENLETDFWLNPGQFSKVKILENAPQVKHLKSFHHNTYCYTHDGNKFWELSASEPHHVLEDLLRIFHPELHLTGDFHFYKQVTH